MELHSTENDTTPRPKGLTPCRESLVLSKIFFTGKIETYAAEVLDCFGLATMRAEPGTRWPQGSKVRWHGFLPNQSRQGQKACGQALPRGARRRVTRA